MWSAMLDKAIDPSRAGGKAAGLALLARAALPVPRGFVLFAGAPDETIDAELSRRLVALGPGPYAVRSSAVREDRPAGSAAGVLASVVGVEAGGVAAAVRYCRESAFTPRARAYFGESGAGGVGVVVQPMVEGAGGVAFSSDPRGGGRLVIEEAASPGEVVSGGEVARLTLDREHLAVLSREGSSTLDDAAAAELARLALAAEEVLGAPADLEWVRPPSGFVLLQLRPITAMARPRLIWTQRFSGERWTEPATTLGWSIVEPALARYTDWRWASARYLEGSRMVRLVHGVPFFNVTIFRHLVLKTPFTPAPGFALELFPPGEQEAIRARRWVLPSAGLVGLVVAEAILKARWRGHRWLWLTNPRDWSRLAPWIEAAAASALTSRPPDAESAFERARELERWLHRYVGVHLWSLLWANLFYQLLGVLLGPQARLEPALVSGFGLKNLTLRANQAAAALAARAAADPAIAPALAAAKNGREALDAVVGSSLEKPLEDLLARFGHRSHATWEVFARRWRDEPETVMEMVRAQLGATRRPTEAARAAAERELAAAPLDPLRRRLIGWALGRTRVFSLLRENQRFVLDRLMLALRECLLTAARHLERDGKLLAAADGVHLTLGELEALAGGDLAPVEAARRIAERKQEVARNAGARLPTFLDEPLLLAAPGPGDLSGLAVSPGRARGPARVARVLSDLAGVEPGAVLVVKAADPGWTPYFASAAGLVSELGGLLSHAAVVAREYGLPAVANVTDATRRIREGEQVEVDGDAGIVRRV
jgi:phosphohistidine swiveling domain-containing protein